MGYTRKGLQALGVLIKALMSTVVQMGSGAPWSFLGAYLEQGAPDGTYRDVLASLIWASGYTVNCVGALAYAHAAGLLGAFNEWEAALLGWAAGMTLLRCAWTYWCKS